MTPRRLLAFSRGSLLALLCLLALGAAGPTSEVTLVRVWPGWRDESAFKRISEYFTRDENTSGREVRRSHPDQRAGFYFLTRVRHPDVSLEGATFVLQIITPSDPATKQFKFPAGVGPGENVFMLGLTGPDWAGSRVHPVAWRLDLDDADGHSLAHAQSVLWALPVANRTP